MVRTGIGKSINDYRSNEEFGERVKKLIKKWKNLLKEDPVEKKPVKKTEKELNFESVLSMGDQAPVVKKKKKDRIEPPKAELDWSKVCPEINASTYRPKPTYDNKILSPKKSIGKQRDPS